MSVPDQLALVTNPLRSEQERCESMCEILGGIEMPESRCKWFTAVAEALLGNTTEGEDALRTVLHVGTTWQSQIRRAMHLPHLSRLRARRERGTLFQGPVVDALTRADAMDLDQVRAGLSQAVSTGVFPPAQCVAVLPLEAACLRERSRVLADSADPYDMRIMARLLPRLRLYDELADRLDLLDRQCREGVSQAPDLGLVKHLGEKEYGKLLQQLARIPGLTVFPQLLEGQRRLRLDPPQISGLLTLSRSLRFPAPEAGWIDRIFPWMGTHSTHRRWVVEACPTPALQGALRRAGVSFDGGHMVVDPERIDLSQFLDAHTRSVDLSSGRRPPPPDWKGMVMSNITRDALVLALLDNPKVSRVPGLVETVVNLSRSSQVLSHIAMRRELHTGHQNRGVPAALLRARVRLPLTILRRFIHVRFVPKSELRDISQRAPRAEVQREVLDYLKTL